MRVRWAQPAVTTGRAAPLPSVEWNERPSGLSQEVALAKDAPSEPDRLDLKLPCSSGIYSITDILIFFHFR